MTNSHECTHQYCECTHTQDDGETQLPLDPPLQLEETSPSPEGVIPEEGILECVPGMQ